MSQITNASVSNGQGAAAHGTVSRLGPFLCWAVVFADIGTSVYYVPGILYSQYGRLAGLFVILTLSVFVLLTLKYAEVTERFPEGGGVVTVASRALHPWAGALGGMLILVDYFLTAAISSLSGLQYFQVIMPGIRPYLVGITIVVLVVLGVLNWWGIRESASVSAAVAVLALVSDLVVVVMVLVHVPMPTIEHVFTEIFSGRRLTGPILLTGFAGSFLAFSGLESISQLSPVMRVPRRKVAGVALALVVVTVGITSPLLTVFSTTLLCERAGHDDQGFLTCLPTHGQQALDPNQFVSLLGSAYGGPWLGVAVAVSAAALLIFASNTAIIGSYHVFLALTRMKFFPPVVGAYNQVRHTPHVAIGLATGIPIFVLLLVRGNINLLGDMYAFGLLGAFSLTSLSLDIVRTRERRGGAYVGPTQAEEEQELREQQRADEMLASKRTENPPLVGRLATLEPLRPWWERGHAWEKNWRRKVLAQASRVRARVQDLPVWPLGVRLAAAVSAPHARARTVSEPAVKAHGAWPTTKYWLGILTTGLVLLAWGTNLYNKPLATEFGLSVTAVGLLVAVVYQQRLERAGRPHVFPVGALGRMPHSVLVVLPTGADEAARAARAAVVSTACERAGDRTLVFLYVAPATAAPPLRLLEFADRYGRNTEAQEAFSQAEAIARRHGISRKNRVFVYREGGPAQIAEVWRITRPEETVALASQGLAVAVRPDYVRMHEIDGLRVASYISHPRSAVANNTVGEAASSRRAEGGRPPLGSRGARARR